ncbi:MAG: hypothetical protein FJ318_07205 [SAR202 cluster bacterium]|nr:hypothetical protein [SAR202 cluster bacterium]
MVSFPDYTTSANWAQISQLLVTLWFMAVSVIGMALSFVTAHAILVSLAAQRHISQALAARLRPAFYALTAVFAVMVVVSVAVGVTRLDVISDIFYNGQQ